MDQVVRRHSTVFGSRQEAAAHARNDLTQLNQRDYQAALKAAGSDPELQRWVRANKETWFK